MKDGMVNSKQFFKRVDDQLAFYTHRVANF